MAGKDDKLEELMKSAAAKIAEGDFEGAIKNYTEVIDLSPANKKLLATAYNNRGSAKDNLGHYEEALKDYTATISLKPDDKDILASAYNNCGTAKSKINLHDEAIANFDEAIKFNLRYAAAWYNRGLAKARLGYHDEAIVNFDEAIRLNPKDENLLPAAYNNRGFAKNELGRYDDAIADCTKAIDLKPPDKELLASAYNGCGFAKNALSHHDEAIADLDEAIRLSPKNIAAWNNRGLAKDAIGRHEDAIANYDEAIRHDSKNSFAWNNRGSSKARLGDFDGALEDFTEALRLSPENLEIRNNINAIEIHKKIRDSVGEEVDKIKYAEEFEKQAEEYEHREKINRRWSYWAMVGLASIIFFLVATLIVVILWSVRSGILEIEDVVSNPFGLLPWITIIIIITSPLVWAIRLLIAAANKAELMRAEYRHLALVERRMFIYFAKDNTDEGKQIRADYIKATMTNSPSDKLVALQNKASAPSPNPVQNFIETIRSKARGNPPS